MIKDKISVDHSTSTYFFKALCDYFKEDFHHSLSIGAIR